MTTKTGAGHGGPIALAAVCAALVAWLPLRFEILALVAFPFRLLSTTVHELGHGVMALLTGGSFSRYLVFADGSGLAYTAGGWRWAVIPAGYLAVAVFAGGLILIGGLRRGPARALLGIGIVIGLLSLRYSIPSVFSGDVLAGLLTSISGLALGAGLVWVGLQASAAAASFALHLIAFQAALTAFGDLWTLIGLSTANVRVGTDAHSMANLALLPPIVWAALWALASLGITVWAVHRRWGDS